MTSEEMRMSEILLACREALIKLRRLNREKTSYNYIELATHLDQLDKENDKLFAELSDYF